MLAKVEKVSKFGVMIDGDWKNLSKFHKDVTLDDINAGDDVEIELEKDKYITSLKKVGGSPSGSAKQSSAGGQRSPEVQVSITKQAAVKAVFGSPWLGEFYKAMDYSEAVTSAFALVDKIVEYTKVS